MVKVTIIGAGPSGSYAALLLAKAGFSVDVFEDHASIGMPVQCTGVVTQNITKLVKLPKPCVANSIDEVFVKSARHQALFRLRTPEIILRRDAFDKYLARLAKNEGARFRLGHRYADGLIHGGKKSSKPEGILIGADGPLSAVAKHVFRQGNRCLVGAQVRAKLAADHPHRYTVFLGKRCGLFAWMVPESKTMARIGVMAENKSHSLLDSLLRQEFPDAEVMEKQGGLIPLHRSGVKTQIGHTYLVGDAAAMVKASTGGGIITGMGSAALASKAIIEKRSYPLLWRRHLGLQLWAHTRVQRAMSRFLEQDFDRLVQLAAKPRVRSIVEKSDRDNAFSALLGIIAAEPGFLTFLPKAW
ncbi:MAG: geranylgeranyl reductase family protein [Nanoarchaeota archaeon]